MRLARLLTGQRIDAVAQMALYRPEFFGLPMLDFGSEVLRGQSYWTPAEREFIAAYTSRLNDCPFGARIHTRPLESSRAARWTSRTPATVAPNSPPCWP